MNIRYSLIALSILLGSATSAPAQVSVGIGLPGVSIGINMPTYPQLVLIPGYPVYYDPYVNSNYFFYDGLYWVFQGDNWYASSWYNGPWQLTPPEYVPLFVLRIPVRYYRRPPPYFRNWRADAPPRWGEHWGRGWEQRRRGWDRWDHRAVPRAAPLPSYQRQFSGNRYPSAMEQQNSIRSQQYRYQPRDALTRQHWQQRDKPGSAHPEPRQQAPARQRPAPQQDFYPNQQRQQMPIQPQPMQPQPMQQPPQIQHRQIEPQDRGMENRAGRQGGERGNRAERQEQNRGGRPEPQDRGR
ncbi:MAG TPA: hypothetical protein VL051_05280 [Burkholderiaceae bacterium]|nr:hypothetical protein [Burkholderiaceae bacterium]